MDEYVDNLFSAAKDMHELIGDEQNKVYLHCTTGISRSSTLAIVYLALFC